MLRQFSLVNPSAEFLTLTRFILVRNSLLFFVFGLVVHCTKSSPRPPYPARAVGFETVLCKNCSKRIMLFFFFFFFFWWRTSNVISGSKRKHTWQWKTVEDSRKTWLVMTYTIMSQLLYFLLVMVLSGTFQFDINFALTGQWKARDFEFWWGWPTHSTSSKTAEGVSFSRGVSQKILKICDKPDGTPGNSWWGMYRPVLQILTLFQTKNVIFYTRLQSWPLRNCHHSAYIRKPKIFLKPLWIWLFLSYSFGIETINTFIHRSFLENPKRFQTEPFC